ncbi:protein translocase subunit SecD [Chlamydiia bacterium]|nr:protein translocase subunit SecD [Chlamydiia bacterium]
MKNGKFWITTLLLFVIFIILTPSVIFYTRSSDSQILFHDAEKITKQIESKQTDTKNALIPWIKHILNAQGIKVSNCYYQDEFPHIIAVQLNNSNDAEKAIKTINYSAYSGSRPNPSVIYQTSNFNYQDNTFNEKENTSNTIYISTNIKDIDQIHSVNTVVELDKQTREQTYFFKSYSEKLFSKIFDILNKNIFENQIQMCEENSESASRLFGLIDDILLTLDTEEMHNIFVAQMLAKKDVFNKITSLSSFVKNKDSLFKKILARLSKNDKTLKNILSKNSLGLLNPLFDDIYSKNPIISALTNGQAKLNIHDNNYLVSTDNNDEKVVYTDESFHLAFKKRNNISSKQQILLNYYQSQFDSLFPFTVSLYDTIELYNTENLSNILTIDLYKIYHDEYSHTVNTVGKIFSDVKFSEYSSLDNVSSTKDKLYFTSPVWGHASYLNYVEDKNYDTLSRDTSHIILDIDNPVLNEDSVQLFEAVLRDLGYFKSTELSNQTITIYEKSNTFSNYLIGTEEKFVFLPELNMFMLELGSYYERNEFENKLGKENHKFLIKRQEDYEQARRSKNQVQILMHPPIEKSLIWSNFKLFLSKTLRGDEDKALKWGLDLSGGQSIRLEIFDNNGNKIKSKNDLQSAQNELYNRINRLGLSEISISIQGDYLVVDIPDKDDMNASDLVKAVSMHFRIVNEAYSLDIGGMPKDDEKEVIQKLYNLIRSSNHIDHSEEGLRNYVSEILGYNAETNSFEPSDQLGKELIGIGFRVYPKENDDPNAVIIVPDDKTPGNYYVLIDQTVITGYDMQKISIIPNQTGGYGLNFTLKPSRTVNETEFYPAKSLAQWTGKYSSSELSEELKLSTNFSRFDRTSNTMDYGWRLACVLDGKVITAPQLKSALTSGEGTITGPSRSELQQLKTQLKAGSLSFNTRILSEETVSADLGEAEKSDALVAGTASIVFIFSFLIIYYGWSGVVASVAVFVNILIIWAILLNLGAALSLSGIAGIILTVGMSIDANVLIFERMREESRYVEGYSKLIIASYQKAYSAIFDSNITTIIASLILLQFDSGPVKGFALTIIIGIISSMITSLFLTRYYFEVISRRLPNYKPRFLNLFKLSRLSVKTSFFSVMVIASMYVGYSTYVYHAHEIPILGMDFTGGYTTQVTVKSDTSEARMELNNVLSKQGLTPDLFDIRRIGNQSFKIDISSGIEDQISIFENGSNEDKQRWVIETLEQSNLQSFHSFEQDVLGSWSTLSGQLSESMKKNAIIAVYCALAAILIYISIRFEYVYAISSVIALTFDVCTTLSFITLGNYFGLPLNIDLQTIGALLTIIGYSLNDTIVIFDRIREKIKSGAKLNENLISNSVCETFSRTMMTSITTIIVLIILLTYGGPTLFPFCSIMAFGVFTGTCSSLFIAGYVLITLSAMLKKKSHGASKLPR